MNATPDNPVRLADLSELVGVFQDGYTSEDIDRNLLEAGQALGLDLRCVWEFEDECGTGGHSEFVAVKDGKAYDIPEGLWQLLDESDTEDVLIANILGEERPDIKLHELIETGGSGINMVYENRLADTDDED